MDAWETFQRDFPSEFSGYPEVGRQGFFHGWDACTVWVAITHLMKAGMRRSGRNPKGRRFRMEASGPFCNLLHLGIGFVGVCCCWEAFSPFLLMVV